MKIKQKSKFGARGIALGSMVAVAALAVGAGDSPEYPPFELKPGSHVSEPAFCKDYLDWIDFRAGLSRFDADYVKRLEEARFAVRQHMAYLDEQPFLAATAELYRKYLKDLDVIQERIVRWEAVKNNGGSPNYGEAVASLLRDTVYAKGDAIAADVLTRNYFAGRMRADALLPVAEGEQDRNRLLECHDLYFAALGNVPAGKVYDPFRIDVLRKAVGAGRLAFMLGGGKPERGFAQSVNPADAREFVRLCMTLRQLSPPDIEGEVRAAAAIGKWGAGDLRGAYEEALPVVELRRTDGAFAVFCARLASASGRSADGLKWLAQSLRGDVRNFPSVELLKVNPDFANIRTKEAPGFATLVGRLEIFENLAAVEASARAAVSEPSSLDIYKDLYERLAITESPSLRDRMLACTILGLRVNGKGSLVADMETQFAAMEPGQALQASLSAESLMDACPDCNGAGIDLKENRRCARCSGTGTCAFEYCKNGVRVSPFDRGVGGRPPVRGKCGDCKGTAVCRACAGKGKLPCPACEGVGRAFSKARMEAKLKAIAIETASLAASEMKAYLNKVKLLPVR